MQFVGCSLCKLCETVQSLTQPWLTASPSAPGSSPLQAGMAGVQGPWGTGSCVNWIFRELTWLLYSCAKVESPTLGAPNKMTSTVGAFARGVAGGCLGGWGWRAGRRQMGTRSAQAFACQAASAISGRPVAACCIPPCHPLTALPIVAFRCRCAASASSWATEPPRLQPARNTWGVEAAPTTRVSRADWTRGHTCGVCKRRTDSWAGCACRLSSCNTRGHRIQPSQEESAQSPPPPPCQQSVPTPPCLFEGHARPMRHPAATKVPRKERVARCLQGWQLAVVKEALEVAEVAVRPHANTCKRLHPPDCTSSLGTIRSWRRYHALGTPAGSAGGCAARTPGAGVAPAPPASGWRSPPAASPVAAAGTPKGRWCTACTRGR